jgi:TolB protein
VGAGAPLYYDWIANDQLLTHIGTGPDAFLGEVGFDGVAADPTLGAPGDFRSVGVSQDGATITFVRAAADQGRAASVVTAARDGSAEQSMPVFGSAAVSFSPNAAIVASIGAIEPDAEALDIPLGPLRLMEVATGAVRTLLDGRVASFWWSPDGKTIAALRVELVPETPAPSGSSASAAARTTEVHLLFVDVATGDIRSQPVVRPGSRFINGQLAYFDQYALSHRVWAPDSSSLLLPESGPDDESIITIRFPDGAPPLAVPGEIGFWSP